MKKFIYATALLLLACCLSPTMSVAQKKNKKQPPVTVTLQSELEQLYRPDLLPQYRTGIVEQESSYDRTGNNDDGFSGKYSYIRKENGNLVLIDVKGAGVINRIWTPTPTTDTIQFYIDGEKTPRISIPFIDLFSGKVFPFVNPVCGNEVGGYYCYVPIQFSKSCKIVYVGPKIEFHQIQWRLYPEGAKVEPFSMNWSETDKAELAKAQQYWSIQPNPLVQTQKFGADVKVETKQFFLSPGESVPFFTRNEGGRVVGFEIDCGTALEGKNKDIMLDARWDDDTAPAIYSPAADFFGYAYGKPAMQSILVGNSQGVNYSYLPMPFSKKADMKLTYEKRTSEAQPKVEITTKVYYTTVAQNPETEGRLYTIWRREINPKDGEPYLFAKMEGKGHYAGIIQIAQGLRPGMTLFFEGDDSTVVDNKMRMHGTGSEDLYNGGWYALLDRWDRGVSLPIHGSLDYSLPMARTGAYRFYMTDKLTYENNFMQTIEHGPEHNKFPVDYTSVAFYYSNKPAPESTVQPTENLRTVYYPTKHIFYPQLMNLSLGWDTQIEHKGRLIATVANEGLVRIMLNEIPEGKYKIALTYFETPDGGEFSIWNRQKMVTDWKSANAPQEKVIREQALGEVLITRHTNSITIRVKKTDKGQKFHFENLFLEKID